MLVPAGAEVEAEFVFAAAAVVAVVGLVAVAV